MQLKHILYSILLFLFIFSFPIFSIINSSHIAGIFAAFSLLVIKNGNYYLKLIIRKKITVCIFLFYIAMLFYSTLNTTLLEKYDYTMQKTIINNIFSYIVCILFISLYFSIFNKDSYIEKDLSIALILQSVIILSMLLSPDIRLLIQDLIRTDDEMKRMAAYDGVRGLGLSGSIAFGLAITMGLLSYVFIYWISAFSKLSSIAKSLFFLLILIASLSAGRTSILAFIIGGIYLLINFKTIFLLRKTSKYLCIFLSMTSIIVVLLMGDTSLNNTLTRYSDYAFQPIINYFEHGSFSVSSTERLKEMYFLPEKESTIIVGDGRYSDSNGAYYMNTDSGYLRFMLYFGILGSIIPYLAFLIFCLYSAKKSQKVSPKLKYFFFLIIFMSFIFHYKAEVIFYNVAYMKIIYLLGFSYIIKESLQEKQRKQYENW
ncbi:TPA: hypothetical protein ACS7XF_003311 [Providencia alcalifaciens]